MFSDKLRCRFESNFHKGSGCWIWLRGKMPSGYGSFGYRGRTHTAHTVAYQMYVGSIPDGKEVLHTCDNHACVNPEHLYTGTQADNVEDMYRRKRKKVKLSAKQVERIKVEYRRVSYHKSNVKQLAIKYGVDRSMITMIASGRYIHQYAS